MENWREELIAGGKSLAEVKMQGGIFSRDSLSPLLFVIAMMPLNHILREVTGRYKLHKRQEEYKQPNIRGGARGIMITVVGNGHGDTSSNPGRD